MRYKLELFSIFSMYDFLLYIFSVNIASTDLQVGDFPNCKSISFEIKNNGLLHNHIPSNKEKNKMNSVYCNSSSQYRQCENL